MKKKLTAFFDKAKNINHGVPLLSESEIRNRLGTKSKFSNKIHLPKINGVTKMLIIGSAFLTVFLGMFLLFNPQETDVSALYNNKTKIKKEEIISSTPSKKVSNKEDKHEIHIPVGKNFIPILKLTKEELKALDINITREGISYITEHIFLSENIDKNLPKNYFTDKKYPKSLEGKLIRMLRYTKDYHLEKDYMEYTGWSLVEAKKYYPIEYSYHYKTNNGKFGSATREIESPPLVEEESMKYIIRSKSDFTRTIASDILEIETKGNKKHFDIAKSDYFDVSGYPILSDFIPLYIRNKTKDGTEHHLFWFVPTQELVQRLPIRYKDMINNRYDLTDYYSVDERLKQEFDTKDNMDNDNDFVPQTIAGIEKLKLTWNELKKIGIKVENGKIVCFGQERYDTKDKPQSYFNFLKNRGYPTDVDFGIYRRKTLIDTVNYEMTHEMLDYGNWDLKIASRVLPVAITNLYERYVFKEKYDKYIHSITQVEYIDNKSPLLEEYSETADVINYTTNGYQAKLKLLLPVNIFLGDPNAKDSSRLRYADLNIWFFATDEFVEKLPDRYRTPIQKELELLSFIESGGLSYQEACDALKGESYFGLCSTESENIKNLSVYPNPSNDGDFNLKFDLKKRCKLSFDVYDINGNKRGNIDGMLTRKKDSISLILELGDDFGSGVYLLNISTDLGDRVVTKIMIDR